jgi:hypothetical protein
MPARVFISYAHADETYRDQLDKHLSILQRAGIVEIWHDRRLMAGDEWDHGIKSELERADIILLLVSPDFIASGYINDVEIARAMERHEGGSACVIPVILRPCKWEITPFAKLQALPKDAKAISQWPNIDEAYLDVANGIHRAVEKLAKGSQVPRSAPSPRATAGSTGGSPPRSGNLRVTKRFTNADKDTFKHDAFDFIRRYIEGSLTELSDRNPDIRINFRPIDANRFTAAIYRNGKKASACTISIGGMLGGTIVYSNNENDTGNSCNESLSVEADDQTLYLKAMGMSMMFSGRNRDEKLSMEGGAELFWSMLIEPLQRT